MNPSLSTVDSLFSALQHVSTVATATNGGSSSSSGGARINSVDLVIDGGKIASRASPSFNDSEPPSYFEVVGAMMSEQRATVQSRPYSMTVNMRQSSQHQQQQSAGQRCTTIPTTNSNKEFTAIGKLDNHIDSLQACFC